MRGPQGATLVTGIVQMRIFPAKPQDLGVLRKVIVLILLSTFATSLSAQGTDQVSSSVGTESAHAEQQSSSSDPSVQMVRTESPRQTFGSFLRLSRELEKRLGNYWADKTRANQNRVSLLYPQFESLLDLSSVPRASREEVGKNTLAALLDIFGRIDLPPQESIPDAEAFDDKSTSAKWRIPNTRLQIIRIDEGPREGEFLFGPRTVDVAPTFYERIENLPLRSSLGIRSWSRLLRHITGPMIPAKFVSAVPENLKETWLDTPIWKVLVTLLLGFVAAAALVLWHRVVNLTRPENKVARLLREALTPIAILLVVASLSHFIGGELNVTGRFGTAVNFTRTVVTYLALVWLFWLAVSAFVEWIIKSTNKIPDRGLDAELLRVGSYVIGFVGAVLILAYGAQDLGLPVLSLVAGLGIGGLAVALAIRPTLENLIGGLILYMDRPVRVGDFCGFGNRRGTVENIGVRSTQIRALDRTLISVPNSTFADMEITNWARCDKMLINATVGLRYETGTDQLRYVLVKMREMFHAHPRIDSDTVRVRFAGYGDSSLNIDLRVYALTREWNDFYAIREDVFLRVNDIVAEAGTSFAFPSQTVYMGRDQGLDDKLSEAASEQVQTWRRSRNLPFPRLASSRVAQLEDSLDYPPRGSPEAASSSAKLECSDAAEPLSSEPQSEKKEKPEPPC